MDQIYLDLQDKLLPTPQTHCQQNTLPPRDKKVYMPPPPKDNFWNSPNACNALFKMVFTNALQGGASSSSGSGAAPAPAPSSAPIPPPGAPITADFFRQAMQAAGASHRQREEAEQQQPQEPVVTEVS